MLALVTFLVQVAAPSAQLVAVHGNADPIALAVGEDGSRLYSAEGASIAELELVEGRLVERRRVAVDATLVALHALGRRLFVAGSERGVGVLDLDAETPTVRWIDRVDGASCTALAFDAERCVATFAARGRSELRVYAARTLERAGAVRVDGLALDVELSEGRAYLALGPAGVARVDARSPGALAVEPGPALTGPRARAGRRAPWARDVAIAHGTLHVAADDAGLVELALDGAWSDARRRVVPLSLGGKPAYAIRVAVDGSRVAVGTTRGPAEACDGAPYGLFGTIGWNLDVGAVDPKSFELGASEGLWLFEHASEQCELRRSEPIEHSGWRTLVLRGERTYEQHLRIGTVVRELTLGAPNASGEPEPPAAQRAWSVRELARRQPPGLPAIDGAASLRDPRLLLFGIDTAGSLARGLLRIGEDGTLALARGFEQSAPLGLGVGAQWLDREPTREWFVSNGLLAWRVQRLSLGAAPRLESWELRPPTPPDAERGGVRGNSYLNSALAGELLLTTRYGSRFGLLGWAIEDVRAAAEGSKPGSALALEPRWQVRTHEDDEAAPCFTWNTCVFTLADGRSIAAVAAGANGRAGGEHFEKPQVALFDLSRGVAAPPERLAYVYGTGAKGLAIAVQAFELGERRQLAVATTGGELLLVDVEDPTHPRLEGTWVAPEHPYDGVRDPLLDLELWPSADGSRVAAWVAAGRSGLLAAELGAADALATLRVIDDTPGWAAGLATTTLDGARRLVLGDQRAGLRVYR
ncbi:MAG: hypothetical protein IT453_00105 [Planctomycetes bacterium]|nr:hypothetical protein [Planctomycetota bacterium]